MMSILLLYVLFPSAAPFARHSVVAPSSFQHVDLAEGLRQYLAARLASGRRVCRYSLRSPARSAVAVGA